MFKPNFFIIGAPKTATTSIAHWLSTHPEVFMCKPKEPNFFCQDINISRAASNFNQYLQLFSSARDHHVAIGEASTNYLRSTCAVSNILEKFNDAKFIVGLRNPVEISISLHSQLVKTGREPIQDFIRAWNLQDHRSRGLFLPVGASDPINYYNCSCLGTQLLRLQQLAPKDSIFIYFYEDICKDPKNEYIRLCQFLGVSPNHQVTLPVLNKRVPHSTVSSFLRRVLLVIKYNLSSMGVHIHSTGYGELVSSLFNSPNIIDESEELKQFKKQLVSLYASEIRLLEVLTQRDLSHWFL